MSTREHHVAGRPPHWSRRAQGFRNFDGTPPEPDWRQHRPAAPLHVPSCRRRMHARLLKLRDWALRQIHEDPRQRRIICNYLLVTTWVVMIAIGVLAAHGVHPW